MFHRAAVKNKGSGLAWNLEGEVDNEGAFEELTEHGKRAEMSCYRLVFYGPRTFSAPASVLAPLTSVITF
jgi:hypothetical protein